MQDCLIGTVVAEDAVLAYPAERHRLFSTVMVIMSGIDLLAKFHAGNDDKGGVYDRFTAFVAAFMFNSDPSATEYAEVLYLGCRNPLLHSFSFHQQDYHITVIDRWSPSDLLTPSMIGTGFPVTSSRRTSNTTANTTPSRAYTR